jgi:hypothetical protein
VDSLTCLPQQVAAYDRVLGHSWLVAAGRNFAKVAAKVSVRWGLIRATTADGGPRRDDNGAGRNGPPPRLSRNCDGLPLAGHRHMGSNSIASTM